MPLLVLLIFLLLTEIHSSPLTPPASWPSPSGDFAFGFRPLDSDPSRFLLAVFYAKITAQTVVWSANGPNPVSKRSTAVLTPDGQLILYDVDDHGEQVTVWNAGVNNATAASMLDTGNFVLSGTGAATIWQTFDNPTDTILPGQSLKQGTSIYARLMDDDYSPGRFVLALQTDGKLALYPVAYPTKATYGAYWATTTSGAGIRLVFNETGSIDLVLADNSKVPVLAAPVLSGDNFLRATLDPDGAFRQYAFGKSRKGAWTVVNSIASDVCNRVFDGGSGVCGFNSYCIPDAGGRANCLCPPKYSFLDPARKFRGCKPDFPCQTCEPGGEAAFGVGSAGNTSNSSRPRKEKRLTYVLNDADDTKHCAGVNCLSILKASTSDSCNYLFTGSRDGTLKRWALTDDEASCSATFESHIDWVNDAVLAGNTLVSCSSDTTVKTWNCLSDGACTRTLRQHSDYVICLAAADENSNIVASGGLGGEVFIWDIEAALLPVTKSVDATEDESSNGIFGSGNSGLPLTNLRTINSGNHISVHNQSHSYSPVTAKGHKDSVYALAMNDTGTLLVSGGTEKVVRVWDPRTGSKNMKLRGHTDNIRTLLLDSTGRFCLSGSSDSMIRLWDLGQQRCVHSYAVHTDSVWALASTPTFSHVYSGGRDLSLYLTDLSTRESILLCKKEHPILQLALQDDIIWVATTDSSVHRWPAEGCNPQKVFQRGGSFLAGNLSFSRARASLEGSTPVPVYKEPTLTIPGIPGIVQHEILNNRRHVLTKDAAGSVKLWEITRGVVIEDYGKVSFEEKKEELFEMVSIPAWFTMDTRLGSLSIHLDTPQCFSAEMYAADLNIPGASEDYKINLAQETLRGLLAHWLVKKRQRPGAQASSNGDISPGRDVSMRTLPHSRIDVDEATENHNATTLSAFEFSTVSPPSIITEGTYGGSWRKKITELDGTEDEKDLPGWCIDCVLNGRMPPRENTKCSFFLHPSEGSTVQVLTQGKLSAPRILRIHKVVNYVIEKMVLDKPFEGGSSDGTFGLGLGAGQSQLSSIGDSSFRSGLKPWQKMKPSIEILCNNQVLSPEMSLATVRAYVWKKPEDLVLNYRLTQSR